LKEKLKIGIQGGTASFHDTVSRLYFKENIEVVECETFRKLCEVVENGEVDYAMMAIENSIAGSIMQNYSLLKEFNLQVIGEIKLRIMMHLMALPGQKIENITKVISHYMALLQCSEFLKQYPNMIEEKTHDTADSAKLIKESSLKGVAAIASHRAAKVYGLEVLASEIETIKQNFTRFLVLQKRKDTSIIDNINKAMLSFELPNTIGSLARTLKLIVDYQINLTKIQSVPLIGKPDQYTFYVDCEFEDFKAYKDCIEKVKDIVLNLNTIGEYPKGKTVYDNI